MEISREDLVLIKDKLEMFPAVVILGPRQVGKTSLALQLAKSLGKPYLYLDMESQRDIAKLGEDAETFFEYHQDKLLILDEIQAQPQLFALLRSVIDRKRATGRFLLLGSATPELVKGVSESLAGWISYLYLNPLKLREVLPEFTIEHHWFRGGFPLALLARNDAAYTDWMQSFIRTYIQSDLSLVYGYALNPAITQRLLIMLANSHGQLLNLQDIGRSIGVTSPVINRYIDFLEGAFLVYRLQPWFPNVTKRLVKSSKLYINDSGLLHGLLFIESFDKLTLNPIIGASWEGYAIAQINYHKKQNLSSYFYRTHTGSEVDLVLVRAGQAVASIEIKYSNAPKPTKGFYIGLEDLKTSRNYIITPASETYPCKADTLVCSLKNFIEHYLPQI
jgi:predicted AAA+ superfamily ATPase